MTKDPVLALLIEILNLTHPRFALAAGRQYSADEAREPPAARKHRERPFLMEFYHEFRRLWDRAVPVQRGLGHLIIQDDPDAGSRTPDLLFWKLGERGEPDQRLAAVSFAFLSNPDAVAADRTLLRRYRTAPAYPYAVSVVIGVDTGPGVPGAAPADDVATIFFDISRWQAVPV